MPLLSKRSGLLGDAALVLATSCAVLSPLAFGAVHPPVLVAFTAVAVLALVLSVVDRVWSGRPLALSWLGLPFAVGLLFTVTSLVPLPESILALLSPALHERSLWVTELLSDEARAMVWPVLSVDGAAGAGHVLRLLAAGCVFVVVAGRTHRRRARQLAWRVVLVGALALFATAALHRLLEAQLIWGLIPRHVVTPFNAPMINPNHLARMFGAFALLCAGRALVVRDRVEKVWFAAAGGLCALGVFLTLSRGGILALVAVVVLVGVVEVTRGEDNSARPSANPLARYTGALGVQVGLLAALAAGVFFAREALVDEVADLENESIETSKAKLYAPTLRLIVANWWRGVSPGGFSSTFTFHVEPGEIETVTFSHPENIVLQTLADHGVLVGGGLLVVGAALGIYLLRHLESRSERAALGGLIFLVVGDLFDFVLEVASGALLAAVALGLCAGRLRSRGRTEQRVPRAVAVALGVGAILLATAASVPALSDDRWLTDRRLAAATSPEERTAAFERALARHPHDAHYAYSLSVLARQRRDVQGALRWANRAMVLWPAHGPSHVEAARALAATGRLDQALLEYRLAWASGSIDRKRLLREVAQRTKDTTLRARAIPAEDSESLQMLCWTLEREKRVDEAQACWDERANASGASDTAKERSVLMALRRKDASGAGERLARHYTGRPLDGRLAKMAVDVIAIDQGLDAAWTKSVELLAEATDKRPILKWQLAAAKKRDKPSDELTTLRKLRAVTDSPLAVDALDWYEADLLERSGEPARALRRWEQLARRAPRDVEPILRQSRLELQLGMVNRAELTHAKAVRLAPTDKRVLQLGIAISNARLNPERVNAGARGGRRR